MLRAACAVRQKGKINIAIACSLRSFCAHGLFPVRFRADVGIGALAFEKNKQTPALKRRERYHVGFGKRLKKRKKKKKKGSQMWGLLHPLPMPFK